MNKTIEKDPESVNCGIVIKQLCFAIKKHLNICERKTAFLNLHHRSCEWVFAIFRGITLFGKDPVYLVQLLYWEEKHY